MENFYLNELITATKGEFMSGDPHAPVKSISIDTRTLAKDDYYIALKGANYDGYDFIKQAIEKKAAGLILSFDVLKLDSSIQAFPTFPSIVRVRDTNRAICDIAAAYRRKWKMPVVAVTGSNGKTTTRDMLASILNLDGPTLSNKGNLNNQIGVPLTLFNLGTLYNYAVIEIGTSWPGEIQRLSEITAPDIGIITNIGFTHLENFKDREGVFKEKRMLVESLPQSGAAVLNADDPFLREIKSGKEQITFGTAEGADVRAKNIRLWPDLPSFEMQLAGNNIHVRLPVYGKFNIYNALAAAAAAHKLGVSPELIAKGIEQAAAPKWRMEKTQLLSGAIVINDAYNANPSSMKESIENLVQSFPDREKTLVLGDMLELGEDAEKQHRELGRFISSQPVSRVMLFGGLMEKAYDELSSSDAHYFLKKEELAIEIKKHLNSDCVVLFKASRGMKFEEIVEAVLSSEETIGR